MAGDRSDLLVQPSAGPETNDDGDLDEGGLRRDGGLTGGPTVLSAGSWGRLVVRRRCWWVDGGGNIEVEQGDGSAVAVSKVRGANLCLNGRPLALLKQQK